MAISGSFSGSAGKLQLNGAMLGGVIVDNANGRFEGLAGGNTGSYDVTLNTNINNRNLIAALNSVYASAAGNEPGGASGSIQTNDNDGGFAGATFKYDLGHHAILEGAQELQFRDDAIKISSSADTYLDITADGKINLSGAVGANSTFTAEGVVSGAAGTFDALAGTSLALQSGGITAAGAIAGAGAISGSGKLEMLEAEIGRADSLFVVSTLGALTTTAEASLDGGIDVNSSKFTVSTAGAVVADSTVSGAAGTFDAHAGTSLASSKRRHYCCWCDCWCWCHLW